MNMLETPVQKRKRKQMKRAYEIYKEYKDSKGVYRVISETMCVSYNTAKNWIAKMKEQEGDKVWQTNQNS